MIDLSLIKAPEGYPIQDPDTKDIYIFNGEDWVLYWHGYELKGENEMVEATNTTYSYNSNFCGFKLPCGYCTRLCQPCPMQNHTGITWTTHSGSEPTINLNDVTCTTEKSK